VSRTTGWVITNAASTSWSPSHVLSHQSSWPVSLKLAQVRELASVYSFPASPHRPLAVVGPGDVAADGRVRPRQAAENEGLVLGDDLKIDDVLVPARGSGGCVLVSQEAEGLAFRGFHVVRAHAIEPAWLWAVLSSASGVAERRANSSAVGLLALTPAALGVLSVPLPPTAAIAHAFDAMIPRPLVAPSTVDPRSLWEFRDLRVRSAWTRSDEPQLGSGVELGALGTFWAGDVDQADCFAVAAPDRHRTLTHREVRGHREPFHHWSVGDALTTSATIVFTRAMPFRAVHAEAGLLLCKDLLALDVTSGPIASDSGVKSREQLASIIARLLSEGDGPELLGTLTRISGSGQLGLAGLQRLRVPLNQFGTGPTPTASPALGSRIEEELRRNSIQ
jgi:hypothetical protein